MTKIDAAVLDFIVPAMSVDVMTKNADGKKIIKRDAQGHAISTEKILPKERPRFFHTKGGRNIAYTSQKTADFESWIRRSFFEAYSGQGGVWYKGKPWPVHTTFIGCSTDGVNPCIKFRQGRDFLDCQVCTKRRKNLSLLVEVHIKDDRHLDLDNMLKIVLDSLNKVCYFDDTQFCQKKVELIPYVAEEHLRVRIEGLSPYMQSGSVVGGYSIKKLSVDAAKEYVKDLLVYFRLYKKITYEQQFIDDFFNYLLRCDGRKYIITLKEEISSGVSKN